MRPCRRATTWWARRIERRPYSGLAQTHLAQLPALRGGLRVSHDASAAASTRDGSWHLAPGPVLDRL